MTQGYGATAFAKNGYQGHWHNGVDLAASIGTPVLAAEDGEVVATGNQDAYCYRGAYGKFIVIKHNDNLVTLYGHLSKQIVVKGDVVKRGQVIGYSGMTGYATGPHLHFTVFAGPTFYMGPSKVCGPMPYGGDLNPLSYL
jgi:murein DD-endopeptidase MepM/ murein hydrolase activator NlpD